MASLNTKARYKSITARAQTLVHRWGPRTRISALFRRRTKPEFSFVCSAGCGFPELYFGFQSPEFTFSQSNTSRIQFQKQVVTHTPYKRVRRCVIIYKVIVLNYLLWKGVPADATCGIYFIDFPNVLLRAAFGLKYNCTLEISSYKKRCRKKSTRLFKSVLVAGFTEVSTTRRHRKQIIIKSFFFEGSHLTECPSGFDADCVPHDPLNPNCNGKK